MSTWTAKVDGVDKVMAAHINKLQNEKFDLDLVPCVFPEQYGAKGDGVTDDTAAIQDAYDATPEGGLLFFGAKTYLFTGLTITKPVHIRGAGGAIEYPAIAGYGTVLKVSGANYGLIIGSTNDVEQPFTIYQISVENLCIVGSATGRGGIRIGGVGTSTNTSVVDVAVRNVQVINFTSSTAEHVEMSGAADVDGGVGIYIAYGIHLLFENVTLRNNYNGLVENSEGLATTAAFRSCFFKSNLNYGTYLSANRNFGFLDCIWETNGNTGFWAVTPAGSAEYIGNLTVEHCYFEQNVDTAGTYQIVIGNSGGLEIRFATLQNITSNLTAGQIGAGKKHILVDHGREVFIGRIFVGDATAAPVTATNSTSVWISGLRDDAAACVLDANCFQESYHASLGWPVYTNAMFSDYINIVNNKAIRYLDSGGTLRATINIDPGDNLVMRSAAAGGDVYIGTLSKNNLLLSSTGVASWSGDTGVVRQFMYQADALADDGTVVLPDATSGMVFVSCNAEAGMWLVQADGTVTKISGSTNTAAADTDGSLCVYDSGTGATVKNRLGAAGEIRIVYFYN